MTPPRPPLIPLRALLGHPERTAATIAPNATRIAWLAPEGGRLNVEVRTVVDGTDCFVTHDHRRDVRAYWWSQDSRHVLYLQDNDGDENFHLFSAGADGRSAPARDLTPYPGARADVLALPPSRPNVALVVLNARVPECFDAVRIDVRTGHTEVAGNNPGNVTAWLPDVRGRVLGALVVLDGGDLELRVRPAEDGPFRRLRTYAADELAFPVPGRAALAGFLPGGDALWLASAAGADRLRLVRLDLETGAESVIDADDEADLSGVVRHGGSGSLLAACYVRERAVIRPLGSGFAGVAARARGLHGGDPVAFSSDAMGRHWIVQFDHDRDPGATFLLDTATGDAELLFYARPSVDPGALAPMEPVTVTARDGLRLPCYLTLPLGLEPRRLPTVLLVHGGPWDRDTWGFRPDAQFLANRGYAVLQVNFRGSVGFGREFMRAGIGEFARAMHDDLLDALSWAVSSGYADPARVGIYGSSYGGYAALVGAAFTPEVFAAAIANVGPSDLVGLIRSFPVYWRPLLASTWFRYVGDPGTAEEPDDAGVAELEARSPLTRAQDIRTPLLVIHGANDVRVPRAQSDQLVDRLRSLGRRVEYIVTPGEGHAATNQENRIVVCRAIETFLATHLGGRREV